MRDLARRDRLDAAAARRGVALEVLQLDITDRESVDRAVAAVVEAAGGIYGLVNNAGIIMRGYFEDVSDAELRQVFETNLFGTMAVTRAVMPVMRQAGEGRIVIVSSGGGRVAAPGNSAYCASKFALEGFGEALAQEAALWGLQVSLVEPSFVRTELLGRNRHAAQAALNSNGPYYEWFQEVERVADHEMATSPIAADDVAQVVCRALTEPHPRLRYLVRLRAKALIALQRLLPGELFERIWFGQVSRRITAGRPAAGRGA
jgi:NAD(P)-dependent dehydrogenase (short-subunit alcohol dehydrogenase family)